MSNEDLESIALIVVISLSSIFLGIATNWAFGLSAFFGFVSLAGLMAIGR